MSNVLVTGGAGFIGSHLALRLAELGHHVRVVDDLSTGYRKNLDGAAQPIDFQKGDICDEGACRAACAGMDYVFHQAAIPSVPKSIDKPGPSHRTNIDATFFMLQAAVSAKVRRFLYAGSSSVYGNADVAEKHERIKPAPLSPYAVQKHTGELYLPAFFECFGLESISIRYFNVFGPRQDPKSDYAAAIPAFVAAILKGRRPIVYGDGTQTRDFTYVDNVVHGNILAMEAPNAQARGQAVNVACGANISINEVIATINRVLETKIDPRFVDPREGDVMHSTAEISLAREVLGYEPLVSFEEGLRRTIDYYRGFA